FDQLGRIAYKVTGLRKLVLEGRHGLPLPNINRNSHANRTRKATPIEEDAGRLSGGVICSACSACINFSDRGIPSISTCATRPEFAARPREVTTHSRCGEPCAKT